MKAGELRHRVDVQVNAPTKNALLETVDAWATTQTRWASVEPLSGRELFLIQQYSAEITHRVRFRWFAGLTPRNRLCFGGRIFNVISSRNIEERNIELEVMCKELV